MTNGNDVTHITQNTQFYLTKQNLLCTLFLQPTRQRVFVLPSSMSYVGIQECTISFFCKHHCIMGSEQLRVIKGPKTTSLYRVNIC